jgi:hypothetical protein
MKRRGEMAKRQNRRRIRRTTQRAGPRGTPQPPAPSPPTLTANVPIVPPIHAHPVLPETPRRRSWLERVADALTGRTRRGAP